MPLPESAATATRWYGLGASPAISGWRSRNQALQGPSKKRPWANRVSTRSAYVSLGPAKGMVTRGHSAGSRGTSGPALPGGTGWSSSRCASAVKYATSLPSASSRPL